LAKVRNVREQPPSSAVRTAAQQVSDLVIVAEEGNKKLTASVLKDKPQVAVVATFEKLAAQLADTETAVHVRLTKAVY
jgi:hypothetical protein